MFAPLLAAVFFTQVDPTPIDQLCKESMRLWSVPGLAVTIVRSDQVVYLKAHGSRDLAENLPVTIDTIFPMASCSKGFTTLAGAMLVGDGVVSFDDPVRKHLPWFRMKDPLASAEVTLRDLFCHRTGLSAHDGLWYHVDVPLEERIKRTMILDPDFGFRTRFRYQTVLFGAGGLALADAAKTTWPDLVYKCIISPLEMNRSAAVWNPNFDNQAQPYQLNDDGKVEPMERYPHQAYDPAGSVHSTPQDLANYLRFQLGDGDWKGKRLISTEALREPMSPQMVIRKDGLSATLNPDTVQLAYGLGWVVQDYRGKRVVLHGGAIDGFRTQIILLPDAKIGIALCNNLDQSLMNVPLGFSLIDLLLGLPPRDWNGHYQAIHRAEEKKAREHLAELLALAKKGNAPPRLLADYVGAYNDDGYGLSKVTLAKGRITWHWAGHDVPLTPLEGDHFLGSGRLFRTTVFRFDASRGQIVNLEVLGRRFARQP